MCMLAHMLTSFGVKGFKSFVDGRLPLAPLTVLIGANASGKSNLLEAMQLLSWIARATRLSEVVHEQREGRLPVRGRLQDWVVPGGTPFELSASFEGTAPFDSLTLTLGLGLSRGSLRIVAEELDAQPKDTSSLPLYRVEAPATAPSSDLSVAYNNFSRGKNKPHVTCTDQQAVFTQLLSPARFAEKHEEAQQKIPLACSTVGTMLGDALFLDPNPRAMRDYASRDYASLTPDGSNVSALVATTCAKPETKALLLSFVRSLPEQDIVDVSTIEAPRGDVMLSVTETFGGVETPREATLLSDGTLRVLAIATALLSVKDGALVVIEEIDNGVHPRGSETAKLARAPNDAQSGPPGCHSGRGDGRRRRVLPRPRERRQQASAPERSRRLCENCGAGPAWFPGHERPIGTCSKGPTQRRGGSRTA